MTSTVFHVVDVTTWEVAEYETAGMDEKLWLIEPATGDHWLFKPVTRHANPHPKLDATQGENWAEKISAELARLLGAPAARVEMAECDGVSGSISLNLTPPGWEMQPGTVLLSMIVPDYDPTPRGGHAGHTLANIQSALAEYTAPPGWLSLPTKFNAFDVFTGFLIFDAWIANRDRHSENWAVLRAPADFDTACLSPSYDHASSLGYHLARSKMTKIINGRGVAWFATNKATAYRYEDGKEVSLVDFAHRALSCASPEAREHWLGRLSAITRPDWTNIVNGVPEMSPVARTFVTELLEINRRRLLDA